jgi:hypothetical protein
MTIEARRFEIRDLITFELAGIVYQQRQGTDRSGSLRHQASDIIVIGEVAVDRDRPSAPIFDLAGQCVRLSARLPGMHRDRIAVARQCERNRATNALGAAGDEGGARNGIGGIRRGHPGVSESERVSIGPVLRRRGRSCHGHCLRSQRRAHRPH